MRKLVVVLCSILFLISTPVFASNENEIIYMQEEVNKLIENIESQRLDQNTINSFIYSMFVIIAISMIFENFVRSYREKIRIAKKEKLPIKEAYIKLLITYAVHIAITVILSIICYYALNITKIYIWFLVLVTICIVEISPLFTINFLKKNKKE